MMETEVYNNNNNGSTINTTHAVSGVPSPTTMTTTSTIIEHDDDGDEDDVDVSSSLSNRCDNKTTSASQYNKNWSTSSIPTLVSLDETSILEHHHHNHNDGCDVVDPPSPPTSNNISVHQTAVTTIGSAAAGSTVTVSDRRRESTSFLDELRLRNRRKSWQTKLERKRRKGVITPIQSSSTTSLNNNNNINSSISSTGSSIEQPTTRRRNSSYTHTDSGNGSSIESSSHQSRGRNEKRPSWWNIFVPDNFHKSRSRRASQDVGHVARNSESLGHYLRSKSRSVDHGFNAPFDLEALRSKVEGRFESVDRLTKDIEGEKKKVEAPVKTIEYTVSDRDTLTSVAARFDTTPSELTKLNRLASSFIFPGQVLRVPDRSTDQNDVATDSQTSTPTESHNEYHEDLPPEEKELLDSLRPVSPKPGHIERVRTPLGGGGSSSSTLDPEDEVAFRERFLKINVRHITDGQGVVGGVLLVTPNAIIFDPNVSDPLVIEHGPESYGVIAPMEFVVNAAIYYDIAHMRVGSNLESSAANRNEKPEIYHAASNKSSLGGKCSPLDSSLMVKDDTFPELGDDGGGAIGAGDDADSVCSCTERERGGDAFPKAFERDLVTPTNLQHGSDPTDITDALILNSQSQRTLEERRKSLLDHHWAIPSKDRSLEESQDETTPTQASNEPVNILNNILSHVGPLGADPGLVKLSCHDSGIDIRDPLPTLPPIPLPIVPPNPTKKVYSDADIVLSTEWVPPITIAPLTIPTETTSGTAAQHTTNITTTSSLDTNSSDSPGRKKASSVSFSLDSNFDGTDAAGGILSSTFNASTDKDEEKTTETKKNKMLKRLSYPLTWMETLTGSEDDKVSNLPHSADAHHSSVFSKVFSSSPINLVEFGTGLFLSKTPSEESGGSGGPPSAGLYQLSEVPHASQDSVSAQVSTSAVGRSSVGTFIRQHPNNASNDSSKSSSKPPPPRLDYRSMVSVDDMPELFVSFDMKAPHFPLLDDLELIPRPARSCEDPPLYLRLRMGKPSNRPIPRSTPLMSYGKKKMRPEYWFSVPKNRVDDLYRFLQLWVPQRYGELTDDEIRARGFDPVESDTELWDDDSPTGRSSSASRNAGSQDQEGELARESWELIKAPYVKIYSILKTQTGSSDTEASLATMGLSEEALSRSEEIRQALYGFSADSLEVEFTPPDLVGTTEILTDEHREKLCRHLPARAEGYLWTLMFSTSQHGFSLNSMYRKMARLESPILMVIEDTDNNVFGALTSCALKVSDHFYGTGESLLFRFSPKFQVFNWTGENLYFIKGNNESLSIGAGDGKFGIWLDGDLYQGRTEPCGTYGNEPLTPNVDFVVKTLECWAFV